MKKLKLTIIFSLFFPFNISNAIAAGHEDRPPPCRMNLVSQCKAENFTQKQNDLSTLQSYANAMNELVSGREEEKKKNATWTVIRKSFEDSINNIKEEEQLLEVQERKNKNLNEVQSMFIFLEEFKKSNFSDFFYFFFSHSIVYKNTNSALTGAAVEMKQSILELNESINSNEQLLASFDSEIQLLDTKILSINQSINGHESMCATGCLLEYCPSN